MTPKSFLRHKLAVSTLIELETGTFKPVLDDDLKPFQNESPMRVILCAGKIYYEIFQKRALNNQKNIALIRLEQLYPFPDQELRAVLSEYKAVKDMVWCQEEPQNQGAWNAIQQEIRACLLPHQSLRYVGRDISSVPAPGHLHLYREQQDTIIQTVLEKL
jgi:2-oxoglutarate dehydrogenase E1 component